MSARAPLARAIPLIKAEFRKQLGREIGKKLAAKISLTDDSPDVLSFRSMVSSGRQVSGSTGFKGGSTVKTSKFIDSAKKYLNQ